MGERFARERNQIPHRPRAPATGRVFGVFAAAISPEGEKESTKYWLSTLPKDITFRDLVDGDYQELKREIGLRHYEGHGSQTRDSTGKALSLGVGGHPRPPAPRYQKHCIGPSGR
jgi:hypothetical protein